MAIDPKLMEARLNTTHLGRPFEYLSSVGSTQDLVREAARAGAAEGLAVAAGEQTAGKGRSGRSWWSPPAGGLYVSLLVRPELPPQHLAWLTMCAALGTAEGVEAVCGLRLDIKWPNDLEIGGRKLAGILAEGSFLGEELEYAVVGVGLNANVDFDARPDLATSATSLQIQAGHWVDESALLVALLQGIDHHYARLKQGVSPQPTWAARLATLGQPVQATTADGRMLSGVATHVLFDGALCIRLGDGAEQVVRAADVTLSSL